MGGRLVRGGRRVAGDRNGVADCGCIVGFAAIGGGTNAPPQSQDEISCDVFIRQIRHRARQGSCGQCRHGLSRRNLSENLHTTHRFGVCRKWKAAAGKPIIACGHAVASASAGGSQSGRIHIFRSWLISETAKRQRTRLGGRKDEDVIQGSAKHRVCIRFWRGAKERQSHHQTGNQTAADHLCPQKTNYEICMRAGADSL